eukprot:gnl/MRDRNA2_/MRDRNA2_35839_c0_seq1.p1 gnl/MRDRNA2_/MRDRNA2_35839_c0~~gnl/MRDRNA2_/MRDRNA2_35839_c0_seq1.p1  ORF type:complete len:451 (-),score=103.52 gnl/MRDRNA2_/MRDRNA2_35839_c0_seq1:86-1438(-)
MRQDVAAADDELKPICTGCCEADENTFFVQNSSVGAEDEVHVKTGVFKKLPQSGLVGGKMHLHEHGANSVHHRGHDGFSNFVNGFASSSSSMHGIIERPETHRAKIYKDGSRYEGQWADGKFHGFGMLKHSDGAAYEGQFVNGVAHGEGTYSDVDGSVFTGQWEEDVKQGQGVEQWPDGARYQGEFLKGRKHGDGTFIWINGSSYFGQFAEDEFDGEGSYHSHDGRHYTGMFKTGMMCGHGCYRFPDGHVYTGQHKENYRHGEGIFVYKDGQRYEGQWANDAEHGKGRWISVNGACTEGTWKRGVVLTLAGNTKESRSGVQNEINAIKQGGENVTAVGKPKTGVPVVEDAKKRALTIAAMQQVIEPQVLDYKNNHSARFAKDAVIEHAPLSLLQLVEAFFVEVGIQADQVEVRKQPGGKYVFQDQEFLQSWLMYHLMHARYGCVSAAKVK